MAPGTYRFFANTSSLHTPAIQVRKEEQGGGILMLALARDADKQWVAAGVPKIQFNCLDGRCTLARVWDGQSRDAMEIRSAKPGLPENAKLSVITLTAVRIQ